MLKKIILGLGFIATGVCVLILMNHLWGRKEKPGVDHLSNQSQQSNSVNPVALRVDPRKKALGLSTGINVPKLKTPTIMNGGDEPRQFRKIDEASLARGPLVVIDTKEYSQKRNRILKEKLPSYKRVERRAFEQAIAAASLGDFEKKSLVEAYSKWWDERDGIIAGQEYSTRSDAVMDARKKLDEFIVNLLGKSKGVLFIESEISFSNSEFRKGGELSISK